MRRLPEDPELVEFIADGWTAGEIAVEFGVQRNAVDQRMRAMRTYHKANTNEHLMVILIRKGLLKIGKIAETA